MDVVTNFQLATFTSRNLYLFPNWSWLHQRTRISLLRVCLDGKIKSPSPTNVQARVTLFLNGTKKCIIFSKQNWIGVVIFIRILPLHPGQVHKGSFTPSRYQRILVLFVSVGNWLATRRVCIRLRFLLTVSHAILHSNRLVWAVCSISVSLLITLPP